MIFGELTFSENGLSDLNLLKREFWFQVKPAVNESWTHITTELIDEATTTLSTNDVASSFSETAFSQSAISDLGLLVTRENWVAIIESISTETWSNVSPSGSETWSNITPSGDETWKSIGIR
tara:strand:+ start:136 stop:501 length:366 start_codon:yes stop_codon:yes gene_type:complete